MPKRKDPTDDLAMGIVNGVGGLMGGAAKIGWRLYQDAETRRRMGQLLYNDGVTNETAVTYPDRWKF